MHAQDYSPHPIPPDVYTRDYFLRHCGGYERYARSAGGELGGRQQTALTVAHPQPGERVLDLGCGRGELTAACARLECSVRAVDYSPAAVELTRETLQRLPTAIQSRVQLSCDDVLTMRLEGTYDVIFLMDVIEHLTPAQADHLCQRLTAHVHAGTRIILHTDNLAYETRLVPLKRALSLPFTILNQLGRALRGRRREASWAVWWENTWRLRNPHTSAYDNLHITLFTAGALQRYLHAHWPTATIRLWVDGEDDNLVARTLRRWWGQDLWVVATQVSGKR